MKTGFYYNDTHYTELEDLAFGLGLEEISDVEKLEEDYSILVEESELQPFFTLSSEWITERLDDERMSEDGDEVERINDIIKKNLDFSKVNELIPKLYYPNGKNVSITKSDLLECFS